MHIIVPLEISSEEKRVALSPPAVARLLKLGFTVSIEAGAGTAASYSDEEYCAAGAKISKGGKPLWSEADIILKVVAPKSPQETKFLKEKQILISFFWPSRNEALLSELAQKKVDVLAVDCIPRISRAQKSDALSSMANIAGYRAVIEASWHFGRFFTGQVTAAGKAPPAKVLVIGAGVAGLSAIGTANSLGAIVRGFDTRPEVAEQVHSMGAEFLTVDIKEDGSSADGYAKEMSKEFIEAEMALFMEQAKEVDIIITTALVPGKTAPKLITEEMVKSMKLGSVVVDLAAESGGNCELTECGKSIIKHGVTIIGFKDLTSRLANQSSQFYANNLVHLLSDLTPNKDGQLHIDMEDDVARSATIAKDGEITWPPPPIAVSAQSKVIATAEQTPAATKEKRKKSVWTLALPLVCAVLLVGIGSVAPASFLQHFTVFVLACFIGYMVIWNVSPALHTPLMSVTNAISSIIIIGALIQLSQGGFLQTLLATFAVFIASINIFGGFAVTQRMLRMFRKD
ncbi:MAG: Re/Si-specific NAD(P)(+) transhydrogenase subunit alpha [Candidatus Eutrophobiaceae bacterium]